MHQLIVGGQRSGKSRHAEALARTSLRASPHRPMIGVATALAADDEPSPAVFVSNHVGWAMVPLSRGMREHVDELGRLNQAVTRCCSKLTLLVAGQAWTRKVANDAHVA